jgi:hypothetical protein
VAEETIFTDSIIMYLENITKETKIITKSNKEETGVTKIIKPSKCKKFITLKP